MPHRWHKVEFPRRIAINTDENHLPPQKLKEMPIRKSEY